MKISNDKIYTPKWVAKDMVQHFNPSGLILEPFKGTGVFTELLPKAFWCEIEEGRDFFAWTDSVNWIISNPPYSKTMKCFKHAISVADNVVFLVPLWKFFCANGTLQAIRKYGGIKEIRIYGTGASLGFPMGNCIGAVHCQKNFSGDTAWSYAERNKQDKLT